MVQSGMVQSGMVQSGVPSKGPAATKAIAERPVDVPRVLTILVCLLFSASYFFTTIEGSRHIPTWTDEVFTLWMVRDVPTNQLAYGLSQGLETLPPTYYIFLKALGHVLGLHPLTLRLPSILAFYAAMVAVFLLLRKHFGEPVAAFAAAVPCLTAAGKAAVWGRPYAIMVACFALCALLWSDLDPVRPGWKRPAAIAGLLAIAICAHFHSVFIVVTFGLMELVRTVRTKKICWPCWAAFVAGGGTVFLFWPVIAPIYQTTHSATSSPGYYAKPQPAAFLRIMEVDLINPRTTYLIWGLMLVCGVYWLIRSMVSGGGWSAQFREARGRTDDLALAALGSLLFPFLMYAVGALFTGGFNGRYTYILVLGLSVVMAQFVSVLPRADWLALGLLVSVGICYYASIPHETAPDPRMQVLAAATADIPIVTSEASDYFELQENAPRELLPRVFYSVMPVGVQNNDYDPERLAIAWKRFRPMQVVVPEQFFAQHPHFYLLYPGYDRERMTAFVTHHANTVVVARAGIVRLFEVFDLRLQHR
jgi:hypothetical protein